MSEVNEVKPDVKEAAVAPDVKQETGSGTDKAEDYNVPGYRFREVNDKAKALEAELASMKADMKKREEAEAEEREEYKELYEKVKQERDSFAADADRFYAIEKDRKDRLLEEFPEKLRADLSKLDSNTLEQMKDEFKTTVPKVDDSDGGVSGGKPFNWSKLDPKDRKMRFQDIVNNATKGAK